MEVTAQAKLESGEVVSATINYDFGERLEDSVDLFGGEVVHAYFVKDAKIWLQALIRRDLSAGKKSEEIQAHADTSKPGMPPERKAKDPAAQILKLWPDMTEEQRTEFLKKLKEMG